MTTSTREFFAVGVTNPGHRRRDLAAGVALDGILGIEASVDRTGNHGAVPADRR